MSALPIQPNARALAKRERDPANRLVPLDVAASALSRSVGHLRRQCSTDAHLKQFARQVEGRWFIDRGYDERLIDACASTANAESRACEALNRMTETRRDKAISRAIVLLKFRTWRMTGVCVKDDIATFCKKIESQHGIIATRRSLYRWDERASRSSDLSAVAVDLADEPRGNRSGHCSPEAWNLLCEMYLDPRKWSVSKCHRIVERHAKTNGWGWPARRAIELRVKKEIPSQTKTLYREGKKAFDRDFAAPMQQDPEAFAVGERWESDHSMLDFFARAHSGGVWRPVRLWITAWMDWRSRTLVGWHICKSPNTTTIKLALLHALKAGYSVPKLVWLDHGKDYESAALYGLTKQEKRAITAAGEWWANSIQGHGLLGRLGIDPHFALPYNHNGKARIERMFGTMHQDHDKEYTSWCGSKKEDVDPDALKAATKDVMSLPTIEDVRDKFALWAEWYNATRSHNVADLADRQTGELDSRVEYYYRHLEIEHRLSDPNVLVLLEREWSRPMTVSKHGISLKFGGGIVRYGSTAPELEPFKGTDRRVFVTFDPEDTREISVFDGAYRFICRAKENDTFGGIGKVSAEARKAAFSKRKVQRKAAKQWKTERPPGTSVSELSLDAQRQIEIDETKARLTEMGHDPDTLPPLRPVFTALDGTHDEIEQVEHQLAAGAEHIIGADGQDTERVSVIDLLLDSDEHDDRVSERAPFDLIGAISEGGAFDTDEDTPESFSIIDALSDEPAGAARRDRIIELFQSADESGEHTQEPAGRVSRATGTSVATDGHRIERTEACALEGATSDATDE